jgi:hypothetical protein
MLPKNNESFIIALNKSIDLPTLAFHWTAEAIEDLSSIVPGAKVCVDQSGNGNHGIIFHRALTDDEQHQINTYIARKFGFSLPEH